MSEVKYIASPNEIPAGQKYVLLTYGEESAQTRHPLGLTITVANTVSELSFLTAVHTAKEIAKHARISEVFICTASKRKPGPTHEGMFTYVPTHDELSSNVIGFSIYNEDKQKVGIVKDIALDADGLNGYISSSLSIFVAVGALAAAALPATALEISGAGATFPYPIYAKWADAYKKESGIEMSYQSIGSGGGIKQIEGKTVTFGASDAPLLRAELDREALVQFRW
jgi:periplasmic binding family protein